MLMRLILDNVTAYISQMWWTILQTVYIIWTSFKQQWQLWSCRKAI